MRAAVQPPLRCIERDAHIDDAAFCDAALAVFDDWVAQGLMPLLDRSCTSAAAANDESLSFVAAPHQ
jgi:hypothetical protein